MKTHEIIPIQNNYKECQQQFTDVSTLETHMMMHTEKKQKIKIETYRNCPNCTQLFEHEVDLESHLMKCIKEKPDVYSEMKLPLSSAKQNICTICQKIVKGPFGQMNRHMLIHSGKKPHKCTECNKLFLRSRSLKDHMIVHMEGRIPYKYRKTPHKCDVCSKSFSLPIYLNRHMKRHVAAKTNLNCKSCPFVCKKQDIMQRHNLRRHTGFKCAECEKCFTSSSLLKRHKWIHIKDKLHKCSKCEKTFGQAVHLKSHIVNHFRKEKKPVKCKHGPSEYGDQENIFQHIHIGTHPYACDICTKKFRGFPGLEKHILSHENN